MASYESAVTTVMALMSELADLSGKGEWAGFAELHAPIESSPLGGVSCSLIEHPADGSRAFLLLCPLYPGQMGELQKFADERGALSNLASGVAAWSWMEAPEITDNILPAAILHFVADALGGTDGGSAKGLLADRTRACLRRALMAFRRM